MNSELVSLSKAFTDNLYRIPDYQRGYSWGPKQLKDFWNDLEQLEPKRNHYTGVLTLEEVPRDIYSSWKDDLWIIEAKHFKPYFVVDGQQRLTTAIIAVQSILESVKEDQSLNYDSRADIRKRYISLSKDNGISHSYVFGYEKDNPSYEFLKSKIFLEASDNHSSKEDTVYTLNLAAAKSFFKDRIKDFSFEQLSELYTKITQHLLFNVFTISDDVDVFVAFETMNNRGKPLSHLELLKNRLIYLSTKYPDPSDDSTNHEKSRLRKTINECWKTAYHYLGKNKERPLDDDSFLLIQFLLFFNASLPKPKHMEDDDERIGVSYYERGDSFKDYLLDEVFTSKRLMENADAAPQTHPPLDIKFIYEYALDVKKTVETFYLVNNPDSAELPSEEKILLDQLRRLKNSSSQLLLTAIYKLDLAPSARIDLLTQLERIMFLKSLGYYSRDLYITEDGPLLIAGKMSISALIEKYKKFAEEYSKSKELRDNLQRLGKATSGYYGWRGGRYFLYEYEQSLRAQTKATREKLNWDEFIGEAFESDYITLEHIYPQKASHSYWKSMFDGYTVKQRNVLRNSIGNLVPLSKRKNSSLSNKAFAEKKGSATEKVGFSYGCCSENEVAHEQDWGPRQICERTIRLLKFFEERWGISIGTDAEKLKIAGLDFVGKGGKSAAAALESDFDSEEM